MIFIIRIGGVPQFYVFSLSYDAISQRFRAHPFFRVFRHGGDAHRDLRAYHVLCENDDGDLFYDDLSHRDPSSRDLRDDDLFCGAHLFCDDDLYDNHLLFHYHLLLQSHRKILFFCCIHPKMKFIIRFIDICLLYKNFINKIF